MHAALHGSKLDEIISNCFDKIYNKIEEFQQEKSGWVITSAKHLEINVSKYNPLRGSKSMFKLPSILIKKHSITNIMNDDDYCFAWAITAAIFNIKKNSCTVMDLPDHFSMVINTDGLQFPMELNKIHKFKDLNLNISINVFGIEYSEQNKDYQLIGPYYHTKRRKSQHINLLLIQQGEKQHYMWINNISGLLYKQISNHGGKKFICDGCLTLFQNSDAVLRHQNESECFRTVAKLPGENEFISFKNYHRSMKVPFVVYADFESIIEPTSSSLSSSTSTTSNTQIVSTHTPCSFCYLIKCEYDDSLSILRLYRNPDCDLCHHQYMT